MRSLGRIAVSSTVLGIAMMSGQGVAAAQVPLLDVEIRLDPAAPATGELVSGLRSIEGLAKALEGVRRVDLYVVPAGIDNGVGTATPVDSVSSDVGINQVDFDLVWDSSTTSEHLVDLVVVARTATRTGQIEIPGVRVEPRVVESTTSAPVAASRTPAAPRRATPAVAVAVAVSTGRRVSVVAAPARTVVLAAPRVSAEVGEAQASSFYAVFGQLPFSPAVPAARPVVTRPISDSPRGAWPYVAAGIVMMVSAGHAQRVVHSTGSRRG